MSPYNFATCAQKVFKGGDLKKWHFCVTSLMDGALGVNTHRSQQFQRHAIAKQGDPVYLEMEGLHTFWITLSGSQRHNINRSSHRNLQSLPIIPDDPYSDTNLSK